MYGRERFPARGRRGLCNGGSDARFRRCFVLRQRWCLAAVVFGSGDYWSVMAVAIPFFPL
ncbi:hypothetical protein A2U01_0079401, partial [Trifolium medium]|nr:hypothetical protein [Trifolium medium]